MTLTIEGENGCARLHAQDLDEVLRLASAEVRFALAQLA